jgi:hypothetical protein
MDWVSLGERYPPPGLLLSLGDGSAVEVTEQSLARLIHENCDQPVWRAAQRIVAALVQEARNAQSS